LLLALGCRAAPPEAEPDRAPVAAASMTNAPTVPPPASHDAAVAPATQSAPGLTTADAGPPHGRSDGNRVDPRELERARQAGIRGARAAFGEAPASLMGAPTGSDPVDPGGPSAGDLSGVVVGAIVVEGGQLDQGIVRRYLRRQRTDVAACSIGATQPGTLELRFEIDASGHAIAVTASGMTPQLADCVAQIVRKIRFPEPKDGAPVAVVAPLTFGAD
jgi:hypothetical protein